MDGFTKVMALGGLALVLAIVIAFFWPGILFYAALVLAIVFFPLIVAMCGGFGIKGPSEDHS